ncbi:MAG: NAD(P)-dependent oxidoreductase [Pirellulales bacterium]|nr:NAD(P)-dependent oxidoreductase [Pirellulales bacterium]
MSTLVTGSAGHLGEALVRTLRSGNKAVVGVDRIPSDFTDQVGSITDAKFVERCMAGITTVIHAATLHKPHVATHKRHEFVDVNITGTLNLLEAAVRQRVTAFVFTSTTSTFGGALTPPKDAPAAWITEDVVPIPKNIYGTTKVAAEDLCQLFRRKFDLPCIVLRTSRFFPEPDDNKKVRESFNDDNVKANEFLFRRVDIEDVVSAHLIALERARDIGFAKYIISATTPFTEHDLAELRQDASSVLQRRVPEFRLEFERRDWKMFSSIDRVYVNLKAQQELGWSPRHNFGEVVERLRTNQSVLSELAYLIGKKGYHEREFQDGPYPVE